jgi:hypothetical protein
MGFMDMLRSVQRNRTSAAGGGSPLTGGALNPTRSFPATRQPGLAPTRTMPGFQPMNQMVGGGNVHAPQLAPGTVDRYSSITPQASAQATTLQGQLGSATQNMMQPVSLSTGRAAMVQSALDDFDVAGAPRLAASMQNVGRRSAALGRGGSGMTDRDIGNVQTNFNRDRLLARNDLVRDAAERDVDDRFRTVGTLSGLYGQQHGMDVGQRDELRGERGYQYGLGRDAIEDDIRSQMIGDQMFGSQFNRAMAAANMGNPNAVAQYLGNASGRAGQQASDYYGAAGGMFGDWLARRNGGY